MEINPGPLASQVRGDCQRLDCSASGEVEAIADPSDFYNDGNQCSYDSCGPSGPMNDAITNGIPCPVSGGICYEGACVECFDVGWSQLCGQSLACDGQYCVPGHCVNNSFEPAQGETARDCGGPCRPCAANEGCATGVDCQEGVCAMGLCKNPTCSDGVKNDSESGIDCGAPSCPLCGPGQGCRTGADCASGVCWAGVCEAPSCYDGVRNGEEAGVDCGPACTVPCP